MKVAIIYSTFIMSVWLLGMFLDISGLYLSVRYASKNKVKKSKIGYGIMRIGEVLENFAKEGMIFIPVLVVVEIIKWI